MLRVLKSIRVTALLVFAFLTMAQSSVALSYTLEISESELQEKVSAMMPMQKKNMFVTVTISDPKIDLIKASNKIGVFTNIEVIALGNLKGSGRANITGTLKYDTQKGEFYFKDPTIVSLEVDNVAKKFIPKIKTLTQLAVTKSMAVYPVYKFKDDDIKHKLAKAVLKSVIVEQEKLLVTLSIF
ncbi:MAG: hypothetical protein ACJASG_002245 [Oleiphilaceae bacterium]|jgi:hypothetical protein